jgi:pilus assembly protein FimV
MRSRIENKNGSQSFENSYEEIADIRETVAESSVIDGEETFEEDSVVELDLMDFEEVGAVNNNKYLKSMTIIDEFENDFIDKKTLTGKFESSADSFNLEKLTIQIDGLTSVKKRKKIIMPVRPVVSSDENEDKKGIKKIEVKKAENESKEIHDYEKIEKIKDVIEIKREEEPQKIVKKPETQGKTEQSEIQVEIREIPELKSDIEQILLVAEKVKDLVEELKETKESKNISSEIPKFEINENTLDTIIGNKIGKLQKEIKEAKEAPKAEAERQPAVNSITIEIPDNLSGELPADFNIDELGKINLKEAEVIAEEGLLSFTGGELLKELEVLNILPKEVKETREKTKTVTVKVKPNKEDKEKKKEPEFKEVANEEILKVEEETKQQQREKIGEEVAEPAIITVAKKENNEIIIEPVLEEKKNDKPVDSDANADTAIDIQLKQDEAGKEIKDKNVFIIDSKSNKTGAQLKIPEIDELEDITSTTVDVIGGKAKQLTESESSDKNSITGLIRDNYPTFKDLLKEKEIKDKHLYSDDDIEFVNNSILTHDMAKISLSLKGTEESTLKEKITSPYEQILGLIPDELELIESQLFKRKLDLSKTSTKKAGLDQHPSDTRSLGQYKYILPEPDSLMDHEKKSIEDDISTESALILEEDVSKIRKKLDDSMKKEITETINDITDRITIYEDNNKKNAGESNPKDKEEIKKLLGYLNELFEKLPEENIKNFADSEYFELYKKLL